MDSKTALALAILRINADVQQTPHIFPLDAVQVAELQEVIGVLGDLITALPVTTPRPRRTIRRTAPGICQTCGGETEHDWEVHNAELRAAEREY